MKKIAVASGELRGLLNQEAVVGRKPGHTLIKLDPLKAPLVDELWPRRLAVERRAGGLLVDEVQTKFKLSLGHLAAELGQRRGLFQRLLPCVDVDDAVQLSPRTVWTAYGGHDNNKNTPMKQII